MDLNTQQYYSKEAENFFTSTLNVDMSSIYAKFLPLLEPRSRILDAGCGSGRDAKHFMQLGFQTEAFDASPELCALASEYLGFTVKCARFEDIEYCDEFNAIWACASLLHLSDDYLDVAIDRLCSALLPQGIIYCSFKHGEGESINSSRYFNFQNVSSFSELIVSKKELKIIDHWVSSDNRPKRESEEWLNVILRKD